MSKNTDALRKEQSDLAAKAELIRSSAANEDRGYTPAEATEVDDLLNRAEALNVDIKRSERLDAVGNINRSLVVANATPAAAKPMTAAEYLAGYYSALERGDVGGFIDRAAMYFDRAPAQQGLADNPAIVPEPIVGALIDTITDDTRPVFDSFTSQPMPLSGKQFIRPRITQHVAVGEQTAEFQELVTRKFSLAEDSVTKRTFGGVLEISKQNQDWTDPAIMSLALQSFLSEYAVMTEREAIDFLSGLPTTFSAVNLTTVGDAVTTFVDAVVKVYTQSKRPADTAWIDLPTWAQLASLTNANDDRTALSMIDEALGKLGKGSLRWVVTPWLGSDATPANSIIVGASSLVESYEQRKGLLTAEHPRTLSTEVAYYGYVAFYGRPEGVVRVANS